MNGKNAENERIEELLREAHLPELSPQLQERINAAARRAWNEAPHELPWLIPVRRLVASAAAAILIIWLANYSSDCMLAQWSSGAVHPASQQPADVEALPEMPYSPFVRRLASLDRRSSVLDASALNKHVEALQHVLDESPQSDFAKPPAPAGGRSRLISNPPSAGSYS
jgi:hypothetical protein